MSDLREQIARRLAEAADAAAVPEWSFAGASDYEDARELGRADEVIRLMEWARRECISGHTNLEFGERGEIFATKLDRPLTLPPDGWKP